LVKEYLVMSVKLFWTVGLFTIFFSIVMFLFPQIDLNISGLFYDSEKGFLLKRAYNTLHLGIFRDIMVYLSYGLIALITIMFFCGIFRKNLKMPLSPGACFFILSCFMLAPVLTVNDILKNHWGRARPYRVQQFGGDKTFTPAWVISTQCQKNCSFTSGETANVFCYLALLFVLPRKRLIAAIVIATGTLMTFERVAQGDHFISDALLSGFIDYLLIWIIFYGMQKFKEFYYERSNHRIII